MIPVLFSKDEKQFRTYGLGELSDYLSPPEVKRIRNGEYVFYMKYKADGVLANQISEGMQIKSDAGRRTKWQTFDVVRVKRDSTSYIEVFAHHITYRTMKQAIKPNLGVNQATAEEALRVWNSNLIGGTDWTVQSDITTPNSTKWNIDNFKSARDVLGGVRGSILDVWGGEYEFDNTTIKLHSSMGRKVATLLEYGRNITNLEQDKDQTNVYTSVYPFARHTKEGESEPTLYTMGGQLYVDGKYMDMHNHRKVLVVDFSEEFDQEEVPTQEKLQQLAERYVNNNEIGAPHENIKVQYIDLSTTLDYEDYQVMEEVELNDNIPIVYQPFDIINRNAKVVSITYYPTLNQNKEIELGVIGQRLGQALNRNLSERVNQLEHEQRSMNIPNVNALGNKIWCDTPPEDAEHKIGDTWFEKNGPYTRLRVWNGHQWEIKIDTEDLDTNKRLIEEIEAKLADFQSDFQTIQERNDEELAEFDKQLEELRQSGVSEEQIDEAIKRAGFDSVEIENLRRRLGETSDTAELAVEMIGNDGKTRYSRNRVGNATDGQVEFGGQPLEVTHNGEGFVAGQTYTISFDALCEMLAKVGYTIDFNYPSEVAREVTVKLTPDADVLDTIERTVTDRFEDELFAEQSYTVAISSDFYKTATFRVQTAEDLIRRLDLAFKDIVAGDLTSDRILNWGDNPELVIKGVM